MDDGANPRDEFDRLVVPRNWLMVGECGWMWEDS
jgi:hypothetical protein